MLNIIIILFILNYFWLDRNFCKKKKKIKFLRNIKEINLRENKLKINIKF
jgi:hypothetical protein